MLILFPEEEGRTL